MKSLLWAKPSADEVRKDTAGWRQLRVWLPVVIAMIVILCESTNTFSAENTSTWLRPVFERIFGHVTDRTWAVIHHIGRKSGHLTGYGTVCVTYLRAWLYTLARRPGLRVWGWRLRSTLLAIASTFCIGGLDEWHQTFIPSRTGMFSDVLIDTSGGVVACLLIWLIFWNGLWGRSKAKDDKPLSAVS